jgi:hypothetical protein
MIRRLVLSIVVCLFCVGSVASAADFPSYDPPVVLKSQKVQKKHSVALKRSIATAPLVKPTEVSVAKTVKAVVEKQAVANPEIVPKPDLQEIDLSWVLDPLVANADGAKKEGSAGVEGNLIVAEPGFLTSPYMVIELRGHIVKTPDSTARIDVRIAGKNHTVSWLAEDVQAGKFMITLNEKVPAGALPSYFPVSALAFVTNAAKSGAVMVSLEKINIRIGKVRLATSQ